MSRATLHAFRNDGEISNFAEYKNAHLGAVIVWTKMGEKYGVPNAETMIFNDAVAQKIWNLGRDEKVAEHDRITLVTTFDRVIVYAKDFPRLVAAMRESAKWLPPHCHISAQADDIEKIIELNRTSTDSTIAIAWTQTSVADCWGSGEFDEEEGQVPYNLNKHTLHWDMFANG